jgi:hypothetical protein
MHPACYVACSENHLFRRDTQAHDLYRLAHSEKIALHSSYLEHVSRSEEKHYRCPCGDILRPFDLPKGARKPLLRILRALELPFDWVADAKHEHIDMLRADLETSLKDELWFAYNVPIFQACLNTAWKAGLRGLGIYLLAEIYERFAMLINLQEPAYLDEPAAQSRFWDGMNEEQVLAICYREPRFSWDDVEI